MMEANQWFWEHLTQYFSVDQDLGSGRRGQTLKLIDFDNPENNEFLCVDQFKIQGPTQNIIPDILLFVNGMPLGVIECKSPFVTPDTVRLGGGRRISSLPVIRAKSRRLKVTV